MITVNTVLSSNLASLPSNAYYGDAGSDITSVEHVVLRPFERKAVSCGINIELPIGYAGLVVPRSGLAVKHGISIVNAPGLIDSGYRGDVKVILVNLDPSEEFEVNEGDRIAQLVIVKIVEVEYVEVSNLGSSERNVNGFGSSGIHQK